MNTMNSSQRVDRLDLFAPSREDSFRDLLINHLRAAPWFTVSLVIHAVIGLVLANIEWRVTQVDDPRILQATSLPDEIEPLDDEEPDDEKPEEFEPPIDPLPEPIVTEKPLPIEEEDYDEPIEPLDGNLNTDGIIGIGGGSPRFGRKYVKRTSGTGGGETSQKAVEWGLEWLARHQDPEGFWDCDGFSHQCEDSRCSGRGAALNDVGVTGLALLAFLGRGNTTRTGQYRNVVKRGARYLCSIQDPENGCLASREGVPWMYNHAIATLALTEAYGLSRWPVLRKPAQMAVDFVHESRNPGMAWRYNNDEIDPVEQNDVSVTGWMIMCLTSANDFGLRCDKAAMQDALFYIDRMTDPATGRTGYKERGQGSSRETGDEQIWPFGKTEAMTAVAMLSRIFAGNVLGEIDSQMPPLEAGARLLRARLPCWDRESGCIDYYYWYYGSLALHQMGGVEWKQWKKEMEKALVSSQKHEGCERGSWDPQDDPWGNCGGRIYTTALNTLCLEVYYRYGQVIGDR